MFRSSDRATTDSTGWLDGGKKGTLAQGGRCRVGRGRMRAGREKEKMRDNLSPRRERRVIENEERLVEIGSLHRVSRGQPG